MQLYQSVILILFLFVIHSCGMTDSEKEELKNELKSDLNEAKNKTSQPKKTTKNNQHNSHKFNPIFSVNRTPSQLDHEGSILFTKTWKDRNGDNIALFTGKKEQIWVYHYAFPDGYPKLLRKVRDNEFNCEFDMTLEFMNRTISVTDLDGDNYGELTFAYQKGCRSDVSALNMKLLMLENGEKYIIRGRQTLVLNDYIERGEKNVDPSFYDGPSVFLDHANYVWDRNERIIF